MEFFVSLLVVRRRWIVLTATVWIVLCRLSTAVVDPRAAGRLRSPLFDRQRSHGELPGRGRSTSGLSSPFVGVGGGGNLGGSVGFSPPGQLNAEKLRKRLGADFDAALMSIERPSDLGHVTGVHQSATSTVQPLNLKLYDELLRHVNFTLRDDTTGEVHPLKPSVRKYLEKWLLQRSSCPVRFVWDDLGALFWPRWIRRGVCGGSDETGSETDGSEGSGPTLPSCSWPPGMRCVPEASHAVRLLRWNCRQPRQASTQHLQQSATSSRWNQDKRQQQRGPRGDASTTAKKLWTREELMASAAEHGARTGSGTERVRCYWKKVPYSVTTGCFCSC